MTKPEDIVLVAHVYSIYARAIDEKRPDLLNRVFAPEAELDYRVGPHEFSCTGQEAARYFGEFLQFCYWTSHLIAAPMVEGDDEHAFATARVQATHLQHHEDGRVNRWILRGSYHDKLVNRDGEWLIVQRHCLCPDQEGEFLSDGIRRYPDVSWAPHSVLEA